MKKIAFVIILLSISFLEMIAQNNAIYVYRNDGEFNAFLKSEVDSITYSYFETDSIDHTDRWWVQVIYTSDSIYKIPLSVIDSVSLVTPEPKINKDVFKLTSNHDPYLSSCDTLHFTLSVSTPADMLPSKGNIVVSTYNCMAFADGITAKIISVVKDAEGWHYTCEKVGIDAIFDQLICIGYGYSDTDSSETISKKSTSDEVSLTRPLWNKAWNKTLSYSGTTTTVNASDNAFIKFTINIQLGKSPYLRVDLVNELNTSFDFNATSSFAKYYEQPLINNLQIGRIPIPGTYGLLWITPKFSLSAYFEESATISLDLQAHYNRTDKTSFTFHDSKWSHSYSPITNSGIDVASLSMNGSMEIGLIPDILFAFCGTSVGVGLEYTIGLKETVNFEFDGIAAYDEGIYSSLKNSYARTTIPMKGRIYAQANIFNIETQPLSVSLSSEPQLGTDKYLLPTFSAPKYSKNPTSKSANLKSFVTRNLLLPVQVGMAYYDGDTFLSSDYKTEEYQNQDTWTLNGLQSTFSNMETGKTYTAYPMVKIMGKELRAAPSTKFKEGLSISTGSASNITKNSAQLHGQVTMEDNLDSVFVGIRYKKSGSSNWSNQEKFYSGRNTFSFSVGSLTPNTTYDYQAYIYANHEYTYGELLSFKTLDDPDDPSQGGGGGDGDDDEDKFKLETGTWKFHVTSTHFCDSTPPMTSNEDFELYFDGKAFKYKNIFSAYQYTCYSVSYTGENTIRLTHYTTNIDWYYYDCTATPTSLSGFSDHQTHLNPYWGDPGPHDDYYDISSISATKISDD